MAKRSKAFREGLHQPQDGPLGAHPRIWVRPPDFDEYRRWQDATGGCVRIVTLAPEWPGAAGVIERIVKDGTVVAIGIPKAATAQSAMPYPRAPHSRRTPQRSARPCGGIPITSGTSCRRPPDGRLRRWRSSRRRFLKVALRAKPYPAPCCLRIGHAGRRCAGTLSPGRTGSRSARRAAWCWPAATASPEARSVWTTASRTWPSPESRWLRRSYGDHNALAPGLFLAEQASRPATAPAYGPGCSQTSKSFKTFSTTRVFAEQCGSANLPPLQSCSLRGPK